MTKDTQQRKETPVPRCPDCGHNFYDDSPADTAGRCRWCVAEQSQRSEAWMLPAALRVIADNDGLAPGAAKTIRDAATFIKRRSNPETK